MAKLTVAKVKSLTQPGRYGDGAGLFLHIKDSGAKSWVQRIVIHGRRRDIGLGGYPSVGLAEARNRTANNRQVVAEGRDPLAERRRLAAPTFREAARLVHEAHLPGWRNDKHAKSWLQTLEKHAFPILGNMPVDQIEKTDVLRTLTPIWGTRPETARRVRQRIRSVMRWAMAHGFIEINPAGEAIDGALPRMPRLKDHLRALPYGEVQEALGVVDHSESSLAAKLCLRFGVLTAARSGEARGARWSEIDSGERLWRVPPERMKGGLEHQVPLSGAALEVLKRAEAIWEGSDLVFPSPTGNGRPLSDMTLTKVLRSTGLADRTTVHGFRSSFRVWAAECTGARREVMEFCLAHRVGNDTEESYARTTLLHLRRPLMEEWGEFITGTPVAALGKASPANAT